MLTTAKINMLLFLALLAVGALCASAIDKNGYNRASAHYQAQLAQEHAALQQAAQTAREAAQRRVADQADALIQASAKLNAADQKVDALTNLLLGENMPYQPNTAPRRVKRWCLCLLLSSLTAGCAHTTEPVVVPCPKPTALPQVMTTRPAKPTRLAPAESMPNASSDTTSSTEPIAPK
jgi:hypothetical protein